MADTRIDELRRRLERDPGSRLFAQLAEELRKGGELAEAIRVARAGLVVHPAYPSARLTLGRALLESGDAAGARAELESAARDAPDNILASRFLAQAREVLGDLKGALEQYQKTLLMAPGDRQLQGSLAAIEARMKAPGAPGAASEAATKPPVPRSAPPPLPGAAPGAGAAAPAGTSSGGSPHRTPPAHAEPATARASATSGAAARVAPPSAGPRPAEPPPAAAPEDAGEELPATLRIRASQTLPPPEPRAHPLATPSPAPPPPPASGTTTLPPPLAAPAFAPPHLAGGAQGPGGAVEAPTLPAGSVEEWSEPAAEAPVAAPASESTTPFSSSTLAELYYQQGLVDRAREVYRQLVGQEPGNLKARTRLAELEQGGAASDERAARRLALERTIASLESLLAAVRRR